jgi:hypothetical protein
LFTVRVWINVEPPGEAVIEFEVVLIALYEETRILRLWK